MVSSCASEAVGGSGDGEFNRPCGISVVEVNDDGEVEVYVSDRGNHRIQIFDQQGDFLRKWGVEGEGEGEFKWPAGMCIAATNTGRNEIFVCDAINNDRIQVFR